MAEVMAARAEETDPFAAMLTRARAELSAVNAQVKATTATLEATQATLKTTTKQLADLQAQAAASADKVKAAEAEAAELIRSAKTESGVIRARATKEAKAQLDDVRKRLAAARALLEAPEMGTA